VALRAGPENDRRCRDRVAGFRSLLPDATVAYAPTWYRESATPVARTLLCREPAGVFACNDRLAQAVLEAASERRVATPVLFGFDDAPIAADLHLSTIAIPWSQLADTAAQTAHRRIAGDEATASHVMLAPRPVVRLT
jgi:DNA-binding LacI/PurR family transcriptional regulator